MSDTASTQPTKTGLLTELQLAVSFLTIIPVIDQRRASDDTVAASFEWFPIIGFAIGVALVAEDWLLAHIFAQVIRSVLIIISLTIITGVAPGSRFVSQALSDAPPAGFSWKPIPKAALRCAAFVGGWYSTAGPSTGNACAPDIHR